MYRVFNVFRWLLVAAFFSSAPLLADDSEQQYEFVEWPQLMPEDDLAALMNPPDLISQIEDGSAADSLDAFGEKEIEDETARRFQQALVSTRIVESYKDKDIKIPGFIVPLESDEQQRVTEFFIVPYFGACLHMPPPPPNQIIHVSFEQGVELTNLYDPFWFEGTLQIEMNENALGTSAYSLQLDNARPYDG